MFAAFDSKNMQDDIKTSESSPTNGTWLAARTFTQGCVLAGTYCTSKATLDTGQGTRCMPSCI